MRWQGSKTDRDDVVDVRGQRPTGGRGFGGLGKLSGSGLLLVVVLAVAGHFLGVDLLGQFSGSAQTGSPSSQERGGEVVVDNSPTVEANKLFLRRVMQDVQDTLAARFLAEKHPEAYRFSKLKIFTDAVDTGCGRAGSDTGPFYCPADEFAYLDLSFFAVLSEQLGAPGDFAQAYVIAHEMGHHVQKLLGINELVQRKLKTLPAEEGNRWSVRQELQADCIAGVWGHYKQHGRSNEGFVLETGDIDEGIKAALAIGDDTLQKRAGRRVSPEQWTHGSSEQRIRWFRRGLDRGLLAACNTFDVDFSEL